METLTADGKLAAEMCSGGKAVLGRSGLIR